MIPIAPKDRFPIKIAATILATASLIWIRQQGFHLGQHLATKH
jgi:hypothetical protein